MSHQGCATAAPATSRGSADTMGLGEWTFFYYYVLSLSLTAFIEQVLGVRLLGQRFFSYVDTCVVSFRVQGVEGVVLEATLCFQMRTFVARSALNGGTCPGNRQWTFCNTTARERWNSLVCSTGKDRCSSRGSWAGGMLLFRFSQRLDRVHTRFSP